MLVASLCLFDMCVGGLFEEGWMGETKFARYFQFQLVDRYGFVPISFAFAFVFQRTSWVIIVTVARPRMQECLGT
jgi:hypothetical protein